MCNNTSDPSHTSNGEVHARHSRAANMTFFDGHGGSQSTTMLESLAVKTFWFHDETAPVQLP